ncbi:hypothetical protein ACCY16_17115 [Candidatus Pantoea formicae]|uniref:hypothetical protein n=1 Tax=Candidatus Pantoea formicae TaxID=2608355 RepID=UPI003ED9D1E3
MATGNNGSRKIEIVISIITTISVVCFGGLNIYYSVTQNEERLKFDKQNAESIMLISQRDLFLKNSDHDLSEKKLNNEFLTLALKECNKNDDSSFERIGLYAKSVFGSSKKVGDMLEEIRKNCPQSSQVEHGAEKERTSAEEYEKIGLLRIKESKFIEASDAFINATRENPDKPALWNYRAYSQFKSGDYESARNSISSAIRLNSTDVKINRLIAINASKILCAQKRIADGSNYIQQAINITPGLYDLAKNDIELKKLCNLNFQ